MTEWTRVLYRTSVQEGVSLRCGRDPSTPWIPTQIRRSVVWMERNDTGHSQSSAEGVPLGSPEPKRSRTSGVRWRRTCLFDEGPERMEVLCGLLKVVISLRGPPETGRSEIRGGCVWTWGRFHVESRKGVVWIWRAGQTGTVWEKGTSYKSIYV